MKRALLLVLVAMSVALMAPNPGHPAAQVGPGTFSSGDFTFPGQLTVRGNFLINESALFVNTTSGRIGIGTLTPQVTLDVRGNVSVRQTHTSGSANLIRTSSSTARVEGGDVNTINGFDTGVEVDGGTVGRANSLAAGWLLTGGDASSITGVNIVGGRISGTVTNETGTQIALANLGADPATNRRSIWIQEPIGSATNDYAIYQQGPQTNYFEGTINATNGLITSELCLGGVCETVWPVATEGEPELIHELGPVGPASYLSGNGAIGRGDTAFVITESTVTIIDLKNSTGPNIAGSYSFSGTPRIEATNTHIFDERSGLIRILDIANPADPRVVGNITVSEDVQFMRATPTQLFVGGLNGTISIFDTSIPERPVFISNITDHGAQINGMAIQDNILYYTTFSEALGGYIIAVDITDPQNPVTLGNVSQTYIGGIIVSGPYAYVSNLANIRIYNIQDPTNMQLINTVNSPNGLHGTGEMRIRGEYLYRAYFINGDDEDLFIFDISNPENIEIAYRVEIGNTTGSGGGTSNILEINGRYLHVAKGVVENGGVFVKTYRLPGVDYTSANIGSIRVGSIHARENVHVRGTVDARGGLTTGDAGIRTTGTMSAETVSTQSLRLDTQSARPDCELERRGTLWFEQREGSDDDRLFACMRNGTDAYNWVLVARGE